MQVNHIYNEDCRETAKRLPPNCLDMIITSPPYYNLRDYGHPGQIGQETTPDEYIGSLVRVFRSYRDALKNTGTLWVNIGDSYATYGKNRTPAQARANSTLNGSTNRQASILRQKSKITDGLKAKDLIGIPWMLAFALRADGWYLRQDIIWSKPNPLPESMTDRCTKSHEYIFLFAKTPDYYFDNEAIKEPAIYSASGIQSKKRGAFNGKTSAIKGREAFKYISEKRNKRSVWEVTTKSFKGGHFAVFPRDLVSPCIMAGTSEAGNCSACGAPWLRIVERVKVKKSDMPKGDPRYRPNASKGRYKEATDHNDAGYTQTTTKGWRPSCKCVDAGPVPALVCDPFMGSGTTASVAKSLGRNYIGSELNPEYMGVNANRLHKELGLFNVR